MTNNPFGHIKSWLWCRASSPSGNLKVGNPLPSGNIAEGVSATMSLSQKEHSVPYNEASHWIFLESKWPESVQLVSPLIAKTQRLKKYLLDAVIKNANQAK
jgi:threonine aldolase